MDRKAQLRRSIGARLHEFRSATGETQADLAESVQIATETYGRVERGVCFPSIPTLMRLADTLQITVDEILGRQPVSVSSSQRSPHLQRLLQQLEQMSDERQRQVVQGLLLLIPPEYSGPK